MIRAWPRLSSDVCEAEKDKQSDASLLLPLTVAPLHTAGLLMDNWPTQSSVNDRDKSSFLILPLLIPSEMEWLFSFLTEIFFMLIFYFIHLENK